MWPRLNPRILRRVRIFLSTVPFKSGRQMGRLDPAEQIQFEQRNASRRKGRVDSLSLSLSLSHTHTHTFLRVSNHNTCLWPVTKTSNVFAFCGQIFNAFPTISPRAPLRPTKWTTVPPSRVIWMSSSTSLADVGISLSGRRRVSPALAG